MIGAAAAAVLDSPKILSPTDGMASGDIRPLAAANFTGAGGQAAPPGVLLVAKPAQDEVGKLRKSERIDDQRVEAERQARLAEEEARRPKVVAPVWGVITSNYGPRWGTTHYGLDIANRIGTPIYAATDGVVREAGAASGFGLWVKIERPDGTTTVYGHIDSYAVRVGQRVMAGDLIATVGNRGISTGPHLHFEVWEPSGRKADPLAWLQTHGVAIS
ncbi:M23 family metallopeptidase [Saccharothrix sp. NRRL B-16348]|uniref:M23 family metallopeptidase n=1 Tax=Saccharothrix sp. NRRL B-16348 TaxID=1415542 RepID=UPI000A5DA9EA|nr:M23 family metallopeptidase [Saccharothrix sp. NRRL B-16348]